MVADDSLRKDDRWEKRNNSELRRPGQQICDIQNARGISAFKERIIIGSETSTFIRERLQRRCGVIIKKILFDANCQRTLINFHLTTIKNIIAIWNEVLEIE
ncbi:hypothetical protein PUN28_017508 [Cardiocondyla obscurior]|uniref:Uncharacterized protein n=1 Tax=Cardiocondyla obscurior TaxID=286306 RepID=A0AAW2EJW3_9HYME